MKMEINRGVVKAFIIRLFRPSGRISLGEFWLTMIGLGVFEVMMAIVAGVLGAIYDPLLVLAVPFMLAGVVASVIVCIRRLHDVGLSGFWAFYLSPIFGLPALYVAYIMDADESATRSISRIKEVGSPWLSWILALLLWWMGCAFGVFFVLLCPGQKGENLFGPEPNAKHESVA